MTEDIIHEGDDVEVYVTPRPIPRGVATSNGKNGFYADLGGTIQAINLESGARTWSVEMEGQPILAVADKVIVRRHQMPGVVTLSILDAADGHELGSCDVEFPAGIDTSNQQGQFDLRPSMINDRLVVDWQARSSYAGGAPPPPWVEEDAEQLSGGAFECNFNEQSSVTALSARGSMLSLRASWEYRQDGAWHSHAWQTGAGEATLRLDRTGEEPVLLLESFAADEPIATHSTAVATGEAVAPTVTPDGRFLFVRRTVPAESTWHVWDVIEHREVGSIAYESGSDFPTVVGDQVYYLMPAGTAYHMRAVNLKSDSAIWELELEQAAPRKPSPPPPKF